MAGYSCKDRVRMILSFTILGNQEEKLGNPIPYLRMTQREVALLKIPDFRIRSKGALEKRRGIKRYLDWKKYVWMCCHCQARVDGRRAELKEIEELTNGKQKVQLDCVVYFANKKHADPENCRKSVQDSLFRNDKYVVGAVDYHYDPLRPRVEVTIKERA